MPSKIIVNIPTSHFIKRLRSIKYDQYDLFFGLMVKPINLAQQYFLNEKIKEFCQKYQILDKINDEGMCCGHNLLWLKGARKRKLKDFHASDNILSGPKTLDWLLHVHDILLDFSPDEDLSEISITAIKRYIKHLSYLQEPSKSSSFRKVDPELVTHRKKGQILYFTQNIVGYFTKEQFERLIQYFVPEDHYAVLHISANPSRHAVGIMHDREMGFDYYNCNQNYEDIKVRYGFSVGEVSNNLYNDFNDHFDCLIDNRLIMAISVFSSSPSSTLKEENQVFVDRLMGENKDEISNEHAIILKQQALHYAAERGAFHPLQSLLQENPEAIINELNPQRATALLLAIDAKSIDCVKLLLENGAKVNVSRSPFLHAIRGGTTAIASLLLHYGADPNQPINSAKLVNRMSMNGAILPIVMLDCPLWVAACEGHAEMVKLLIAEKADVTFIVNGYDVFPELEKTLLKKGYMDILAELNLARMRQQLITSNKQDSYCSVSYSKERGFFSNKFTTNENSSGQGNKKQFLM